MSIIERVVSAKRANEKQVTRLNGFPIALFEQPVVEIRRLQQLDVQVEQTTFLAVGGGLGSFTWVDHLLIHGVKADEIVSIGFEEKPHGRYKRLCENSQIPAQERLRSDSGSTPDNIWGWPGYGARECLQSFFQAHWLHSAKLAWQLFTEPVFTDPFTPKAAQVYASIERESKRINWQKIWRYGRVRAIRKTDDGRYAVAYSQPNESAEKHKVIVAQFVHLAVGYAGLRFLPDLQTYREESKDFVHAVNAYEDHAHVYQHLRKHGGTVLLRGRGIVASRLIQRLYEERQHNPNIHIIHLMRTPIPDGSQYDQSQRRATHHVEYQHYNFPKSCFGGDLRALVAEADAETRKQLIATLGGTTTADRHQWLSIIEEGLNEGWYQVRFGQVEKLQQAKNGTLKIFIDNQGKTKERVSLLADFMLDATGLNADLDSNPLLKDLVDTYQLERNVMGRLKINDDFAIETLETTHGQVYACGAMTLGGPFAPVDSFLGLQYAAQQSVNHLGRLKNNSVKRMTLFRSALHWTFWALGVRI